MNDGLGTTFSTTAVAGVRDVADLFSFLGINITSSGADGVGLFNSQCNTSGNPTCVIGSGRDANGDNDLQTGRPLITPAQGNLLISEENPGNGVPDDFEGAGELVFTFDQGGALNNVLLESITLSLIHI